MKKALAFRFISDRLPVLDVQYGQISDGHFQPFDNMIEELNRDLHFVAQCCVANDLLGTQLLLKAKDFGSVLYALFRLEYPYCVRDVETYPLFIVFHLEFIKNEQEKEIEEAG